MLTGLFILAVILQVLDGVSTLAALRRKQVREGNPAAAWFLARTGPLAMVLVFKGLGVLLAILVLLGPFALWVKYTVFVASSIMMLWVIHGNVRLARKYKVRH